MRFGQMEAFNLAKKNFGFRHNKIKLGYISSSPQQCSSDLVSCLKTETDKKECFKDYRACIYALIPPYVVREKETLKVLKA